MPRDSDAYVRAPARVKMTSPKYAPLKGLEMSNSPNWPIADAYAALGSIGKGGTLTDAVLLSTLACTIGDEGPLTP